MQNKIAFHLFLFFLFLPIFINAQNRTVNAQRIKEVPKIDADITDACWENISFNTGFTQFQPKMDTLPSHDTQFKAAYDDDAIYFAVFLPEDEPNTILKELGYYDNIGANADYVCFFLDTYNDDQNGYGFCLSVSGIQSDARYSITEGENWQWNTVWYSKTKITNEGWQAEIKIPYSSLRFPDKAVHNWGIDVWRSIRSKRERSSWANYNPNASGFVNQWGSLNGLSNIESPLRLSVTPYVSTIANLYNPKDGTATLSNFEPRGGADIKYGINESFTLDMTLVPDFSQVQSDDQVQNLSPFEVQFDENRQFFLEGTELFNIGGLFYSRRIGARPLKYFTTANLINTNDELTMLSNPTTTQLINASKVSGRTKKRTGIGVFNAITAETKATAKQQNGEIKEFVTSPISNYNIFVVDQPLKNNSNISFINTNVIRAGHFRDANVSALVFNFKNKSTDYGVNGGVVRSAVFNPNSLTFDEDSLAVNEVKSGYRYNFRAGKIGGKFQVSAGYFAETAEYDHNDLGLLFAPNDNNWNLSLGYFINDPVWKIINGWNYFNINYLRIYTPNKFVGFNLNGENAVTWENWITTGIFYDFNPVAGYDYFEPRVAGRKFKQYANGNINAFISSDYRKTFALDIGGGLGAQPKADNNNWRLWIEPRVRVNDRLKFRHRFSYDNDRETRYADLITEADKSQTIVFAKRDIDTYENRFIGSYIFTSKMALDFRLRHYWRKFTVADYYSLLEDGTTLPYRYNDGISSSSVNFFNIDLTYRWQFSPGSELSLFWQNSISSRAADMFDTTFVGNFGEVFNNPTYNSISLKVVYFLDYAFIKKLGKGRTLKS